MEQEHIVSSQDELSYLSIHWSCYSDDLNLFANILMEDSSLITKKTSKNMSCLHIACCNNAVRIIEKILSTCDHSFLDCTNKWNETSLHISAAGNNKNVVSMLLKAGANWTIKDNWNRTCEMVSRENGYIECARLIQVWDEQHRFDHQLCDVKDNVTDIEDNSSSMSFLQPETKASLFTDLKYTLLKRKKSSDFDLAKVQMIEKNIFATVSDNSSQIILNSPPISTVLPPSKRSLSKLVEYPGDPRFVEACVSSCKGMNYTNNTDTAVDVDLAGRDLFGLTALHKFSSWNKVDLVQLLLPHLSNDAINAQGGEKGYHALHWCVEMNAFDTFEVLLNDPRVELNHKDVNGNTYRELAQITGKVHFLNK